MPRSKKQRTLIALAGLALVLILVGPGGSLVYQGGGGESCVRCHEIRPSFENWSNSAHREVDCTECHGGILTASPHFHTANLRRLVRHVTGDVPTQVLLVQTADVDRISEKCAECHRQQHAAWQAGPHSATYSDIFLDEEHNTKRLLTGDCFRCHGMHFPGSIQDLVEPVSTTGPWKLKAPEMAERPVIPCIACHEVHGHGEPRKPRVRAEARPWTEERVMTSTLALFDRRTQIHAGVASMPLPTVMEGDRRVTMSGDRRQALCYQCHATRAMDSTDQAGTGDDRTAIGVHEGISCLSCHAGHAMEASASCSTCHPRFSNCGLDIPKMNEMLRDPNSRFDIHTVQCADCHPKGVPERRNGLRPASGD